MDSFKYYFFTIILREFFDLNGNIEYLNWYLFRRIESGDNLSAQDKRQTFNTLKISMLNSHNTSISKQLLRIVIDELSVDKDTAAMLNNLLDLLLHLLLLGELELGNLGDRVDLDARAKHLDFISVHWRVGDENLGVLDASRLIKTRLLVQEEALVQVRVGQRAAQLLDDLDGVKVAAAAKTHHCVHC